MAWTDGTAEAAATPMRRVREWGMSLMRIALLQADPTVGDLAGNADRLLALAQQAAEAGANVAVSTELGITGYPPRDLLMSPDFVHAAFEKAQSCMPTIPTLIGTQFLAKTPKPHLRTAWLVSVKGCAARSWP